MKRMIPYKKLFLASTILIVLITLPLIGSVGASLEMWSQTYGGTSSDAAEALVQTSDGGYALAGYTGSLENVYYDFWLVKTDAYGNVEWNQTYGGASHDCAHSLVETSDGGYAIAGFTKSFGAGGYDFWLVKTDANGIPEFPSWIILPLFLIATASTIVVRKRISIPAFAKIYNSLHKRY